MERRTEVEIEIEKTFEKIFSTITDYISASFAQLDRELNMTIKKIEKLKNDGPGSRRSQHIFRVLKPTCDLMKHNVGLSQMFSLSEEVKKFI